MSRAELRYRMGALEQRAEQSWTSHQVMLLDEMNSVAGDALEWKSREEACSVEQIQNFRRHERQNHEHLQEYQQDVERHLAEVQNEVQSHQIASREESKNMRHELTQSLFEEARRQTLYTTSRSGASESSSENQQFRHERDSLITHCRSLETEMQWRHRQSVPLKRKLRRFIDEGECWISNDRSRTRHRQTFQRLDGSKEEVSHSQTRCCEFWRYLEPTPYPRDEVYQSWSGGTWKTPLELCCYWLWRKGY